MNRTRKRLVAGAAAVAAAAAVIAVPTAAQADRGRSDHLAVVGLTENDRLVSFAANNPKRVWNHGAVTGLATGTTLVGIDYRVQDGLLYGVGRDGSIYTINRRAVATKVSQLTVSLDGTAFGVDFNPTADRLRVVSNTGQNLRHDLAAGTPAIDGTTTSDGTLTYPPATSPAPGITAAAYINNDLNATTGTALFDLDTALDQTVVQSPANAGLLAATGKLGVDATSAGFDIYSTTDRGVTVRNRGLAVLTVGGRAGLYEIDLLTGDADLKGRFPGSRQVVDIAIPTGQKKR